MKDKIILVTGGTGSFGRNFIEFLLQYSDVRRIIIFSRDELKQSQMRSQHEDERLRFFIGDVRELPRLERAFNRVDIVIHAAALKQIPTLEYNPFEAVKTNIIGSQNVIDAAINQGVEKVLLISTDKAAQPINLYGSTKLCAEKLFVSGNAYAPDKTRLSCVRYGNVLGSRGSIIEILLKNPDLEEVKLTHEEMTRFWISLRQSFNLVLFALDNMNGGEIFIPKLPSMKLVDIFGALAPNAKKKVIGIRPGEKMHEVLLTHEEARHTLELENYYAILPEYQEVFNIEKRYRNLIEQGKRVDENFSYASNSNSEWMEKEIFLSLIKELKNYDPIR